MRTEIAGKAFSLIMGAVRGTLAVYREGPDNDLVLDLEIDLSFPWSGIGGRYRSAACAQAAGVPER